MYQRRGMLVGLGCLLWGLCAPALSYAQSTTAPEACCPLTSAEVRAPAENSVAGFMSNLFDTSSYPARWNCGSWTSLEGWLHIVSDLAIFAAYFTIPLALIYFIGKRKDFPFHCIFLLFAAFILFCGTTHLLEAIIFYYPVYRLAGLVKLATAAVSLVTVFALLKLIPKALELPSLVSKNELLKQADATKSEFLANMSHEIRTPMTAILGYSELLLEPEMSDSDRNKAVQTIQRNGHHLLEVINDILDLSKIEAGKLSLERRTTNPVELLMDVKELLSERVRAQGNDLQCEIQGEIPQTIQTDPTRLKQALLNLLGNANKFTEHGLVRVRITSDPANETLNYLVTDTGIGMTSKQVEQIFKPFGQADTSTTRKYGGTGLGLTITQRIAELLEGKIQVESTPGVGSEFVLTVSTGPLAGVPLISSSAHLMSDPNSAEAAELKSMLTGSVLLVEDGPDLQRLLKLLLQKAGASVTIAENGEQGMNVALSAWRAGEPFDLILMDMQMPVMDGYTATCKLRDANYPGQIVALTAHAMKSDRERCLAAGCDDYLSKPIERNTFLSAIAKWMDKRSLSNHQPAIESAPPC